MSAPVAIPAAVTAGQTPAGGNAWSQAAAAPATGFEALLAALFPTAPLSTASQGLPGQAKGGLGLIKPSAQTADAAQADDPATAAASDSSALQAQLAALLAVQPLQVQPTAAPATDGGDAVKTPTPAVLATIPVKPEAATLSPALAQTQTVAQAEPPAIPSAPPAPTLPPAPKAAQPPAATPAASQPLVQPAAEPKTAPPPVLAAAVLPLTETVAEPAPETPAEPAPAVTAAVAATAEAKPAVKTDKTEAPAPARAAAAASAGPAPPVQAETAAAAASPQPGADSGHDQPPPDQREAASSDQGAPDVVTAPAGAPTSAAHMIQAEASATAARGAPETVARLAAQIVKKLDGKSSRFDIALDPVGLGKVDVKVEINAQGQMTAALNFDTAAAASELRNRAGELRAALEQAGFDMNNANLSFSFAGQQDNSGQAFAQRDGQRGSARFLQALADDQPVAAPASTSSLLGARTSGVDVRI